MTSELRGSTQLRTIDENKTIVEPELNHSTVEIDDKMKDIAKKVKERRASSSPPPVQWNEPRPTPLDIPKRRQSKEFKLVIMG